MSSSGSRRSYLAALGAGIVVLAASTYGVSLTRAAESLPDTATSAGVTASAVGPASISVQQGAATSSASSSPAPTSATSTAPSSGSAQAPSSPARSSSDAPSANTPSSRPAPAPSSPTAPPSPPPRSTPAPSTPAPATSAAAPASQFKDGTYKATAEYNSPGGVQKVGVTLTLAGDVVTGSSLELFATGIAKAYQTLFQQNYSAQVTGKKIDTIQLGAVGGSSLTSGGFNDAVKAIEGQAHA